MQYTNLGTTGVQVSRLCFGTMSFGGDANEEMSASLFHRCRDAGINFFDCADMYQNGRAEEILGRLMADSRDELVITSKAYFPTGPDRNARGASRRHLFEAIAASLKRLGTDHVDFYFIHRFDEETALEESLRALEDMTERGMILYPAASNFAAWQVQKALGISAQEGWARFACIQPMYNLVRRQAEVELLPMARDARIGVITYSPLAGGLLTGKYGTGEKPAAGRLVNHPRYAARYADPHEYDIAERFAGFARERGFDPAALAVAWVGAHPAITAPIIGARNVAQLESSLNAADIEMTPTLYREISTLSPAPPLATDRSEERTSEQFVGR
jgi:aryl-alcohol dehydrogenase-like predicted oxidoreductase